MLILRYYPSQKNPASELTCNGYSRSGIFQNVEAQTKA